MGTRTHCVVPPLNGVVKQSSIRPRFAPTRGASQQNASFFAASDAFVILRRMPSTLQTPRRARSAEADE